MSFTDTLKSFAGTVAPTLAAALGGPLAGTAVSYIASALGCNPSNQKALQTAMATATPDQLLALKKADQEFAAKMEELGIERDKLAFDDTANARAMQMSAHDPNVARLAWLVIGGFLIISLAQLACMVFAPDAVAKLPQAGWLLVGSISGYLANEAKQAAAFYFGTTAGSQAKDATIADIAKS
jgi:hypothetical protein